MNDNNCIDNNNEDTSTKASLSLLREEVRTKLSRKVRGPGTARLAVDRQSVDETILATTMSISDAVNLLSQMASPVIAPNGVPIYRVERGGEVTFHGPSQLVVYPLLDLQRGSGGGGDHYQKDLHWYLRMIEEVIIQTLQHYDIESQRDPDNTGVWVGDEKVAAVGISSSRWITTHGFALNINPNLEFFDTSVILPCGIEGKGVTSIAKILKARGGEGNNNAYDGNGESIPTIQEVANVVMKSMENVFGVSLVVAPSPL